MTKACTGFAFLGEKQQKHKRQWASNSFRQKGKIPKVLRQRCLQSDNKSYNIPDSSSLS